MMMYKQHFRFPIWIGFEFGFMGFLWVFDKSPLVLVVGIRHHKSIGVKRLKTILEWISVFVVVRWKHQ